MRPIQVTRGDRFGRLTIVQEVDQLFAHRRFECVCQCGAKTIVHLSALRGKLTTSCGCWRKEQSTIHGKWRTAEYRSWSHMIARCDNPSLNCWRNYGGRGISVCQRWRDSFQAFLMDMGMRPSPKHSLDRYPDKNGDYEPGNCRWATMTEQLQNQRRNRLVPYLGRLIPATAAARLAGVSPQTVLSRLNRGWTDRLFEPPSQEKRYFKKSKKAFKP